jgi:hypothetical protein
MIFKIKAYILSSRYTVTWKMLLERASQSTLCLSSGHLHGPTDWPLSPTLLSIAASSSPGTGQKNRQLEERYSPCRCRIFVDNDSETGFLS